MSIHKMQSGCQIDQGIPDTVFLQIVSAETILFLNLTLCTVTFDHSTYRCGNYSRTETIHGYTVHISNVLEQLK